MFSSVWKKGALVEDLEVSIKPIPAGKIYDMSSIDSKWRERGRERAIRFASCSKMIAIRLPLGTKASKYHHCHLRALHTTPSPDAC